MNDVTELEESRRSIEKMAITDDLTGLFNRRYILDFLTSKGTREEGFLVVLPNIISKDAYLCAEQLRKKIENLKITGCPLGTTISLGVAQQGQDINQVIKTADQLFYLAKESGRNMTKLQK